MAFASWLPTFTWRSQRVPARRIPRRAARKKPAANKLCLERLEDRTLLSGTELILNGNFEAGPVNFTSQYSYSPGLIYQVATWNVTTNPRNSHPDASSFGDHTTGLGKMLALNGADTPKVLWSQTAIVEPSTNYSFSMWVATWYPLSPAQIEAEINGSPIGSITAPAFDWSLDAIHSHLEFWCQYIGAHQLKGFEY